MMNSEEIVVVSGSDEGYALPLAVTIASAIKHLGADRRLKVYILDGGISARSKQRLSESWQDPRVSVTWIAGNRESFERLPISHHVNAATYMRLAIAEYLPDSVDRAIYLDADMLVCHDLGELWDQPQDDAALLAVQDYAAPFIDAEKSLSNFGNAAQYLAAYTPIANFRELGIDQNAKYFNGGMLVINLDHWRRHHLADRFLACLEDHREHVLWWDQYALNAVLAGAWKPLDLRWNQGAHLFVYPDAQSSPFDSTTFQQLNSDPWIIHFCSPDKPWNYFSRHPATKAFREIVQATAWRGWKPERPERYLRKLWSHHYKPARERYKANVRKLKTSLGWQRKAA